jgi:hypothetical protein
VAEPNQPGKPLQFGDRTNLSADAAHCGQCEAMLADAIDGTLSPEEQTLFDAHMAACSPCAQLLADARRGAAFLDILRDPAPEPPPALLERILTLTSGTHASPTHLPAAAFAPIPAPAFGATAAYPNLLPFPNRAAAAYRRSSLRQLLLQPRLAMTAAMAFLSIALTLDLTGVRLQDLRISDLQPSSLKRDFYSANARVIQYYEGLRVVYELESRVRDIENNNPTDSESAPADTNTAQPPSQSPDQAPDQPDAQPPQPAGQSPSDRSPAQRRSNPSAQPQRKPHPRPSTPAPNSPTSRREDPSRHLVPLANRNVNSEGGLA